MGFDWILALGLTVSAVLAALGAVLLLAATRSRTPRISHGLFDGTPAEVVFLLDDDVLIDATPAARAILSLGPAVGQPFQRLIAQLSPQFPDLSARLEGLAHEGQFSVQGAEGTTAERTLLTAELRGGLTRIALSEARDTTTAPDRLTLVAMSRELDTLRTLINRSPCLTWRIDSSGHVIWANAAYLATAARQTDAQMGLTWPLPRLFPVVVAAEGSPAQRISLNKTEGGQYWFDLRTVADGRDVLCYAAPVDDLVRAESSLRDFMQTLTKTFAYLPTGLAIFDRKRQLQLFNPALVDLTALPPDFLTMRPTLFAFLDAMRDRKMLPEPKDYRGWRARMADMERAATSGLFQETWTLPSGQTYRVIGRPHPNGALALMFEDISNETTRTRRYRADMELGQSVIDAMDDAMAVFAPTGSLVMTNTAYARMWGHDPGVIVSDLQISNLTTHWRKQSAPTSLWAQAEEFLSTMGHRDPFAGEVRLLDGRLVACRCSGLHGGASLVAFRAVSGQTPNLAISATGTD